ncbi:MAG: transglycosylase domain-containing protein [Patescibacteria group bacterium]
MLKSVVSSLKKLILLVLFEIVDFLVWLGNKILFAVGGLIRHVRDFPIYVKRIPLSKLSNLPKTKNFKLKFKAVPLKIKLKNSAKKKRSIKKRKDKREIKLVPRFFKSFSVFTSGMFFTLVFVWFPFEAYTWYSSLPQPSLLLETEHNKSTKILDRNGKLLYEIYVDKKYDPVPLNEIPDYVVNATLAIEDDAFYFHKGVRPLSMLRAAKAIVLDDHLQGGSTITQQLVKNVLLSPERTFQRKLKEGVLALRVEHTFTKNEILEMYLNNIPYGGTAWGIQAASKKFFNKKVQDLSLAEAAYLVILPSAPTTYSPYDGDKDLAKSKQHFVLDKMHELGYISKAEADLAKNEELVFATPVEYIRAPHFVSYIRSELVKLYGERMVDFGGLTVTTSLNIDLQDKVQEIVAEEVAKSNDLNITNGAAVVLDSENGEILAHVGSINYFDKEHDGAFDVVTAYRSPGSTIKAVTYALALDSGLTPVTQINDSPFTVQAYGQTYSPVNYDGKFHGRVSLRTALANSYNIPAVKLVKALGPDKMVALGKSMGLTNWEVDGSYGLAITLGGKEVRLLDLANVYATLSRNGIYKDTTGLLSVKDALGNEIYRDTRESKRVVSEGASYLLTHILSDSRARLPAFGINSFLDIDGYSVAVKTGTSDEKRDNLTVGYTPSYVVAVWVGNNDYSPMNKQLASGLSGAAPMWNRIMTRTLEGSSPEHFEMPSNVFVFTDSNCNNKVEVFIKGTEPERLCSPGKNFDEKKVNVSKQVRGGGTFE